MKILNQVQLITYADSLGGDLAALRTVLDDVFPGLFAGVHILPPYPSSGDRGFAPIDYRLIDPAFGSWADIAALAQKHQILLDVMVNHMSRRSPFFQDVLEWGRGSEYAEYFLTPQKIWGADEPPRADLEKIVMRRPRPWSDYRAATGETLRMWTTFGATDPSEQIDLDVSNPAVRAYFVELFRLFAANGVSVIRLDAVGYVVKKPGSSCFFVEPEIYEFLNWAVDAARREGVELLSEVHAQSDIQNRLAAQGFQVYDFLLPYTVLHTLFTRDSGLLYRILENRPLNQITTLDCHDGIPVQPDMDGWLDAPGAWNVVDTCRARGAHFTRLHTSEQRDSAMPDVHQICGTYYSLLGADDDAYIAARAIQFFVPGIPQVYYVGLLAGENDEARRVAEQENRELNRHNFTMEEIHTASRKPVVRRLCELIRLRNGHPAFAGEFSALPAGEHGVAFHWQNGGDFCRLDLDLTAMQCRVTRSGGGEMML